MNCPFEEEVSALFDDALGPEDASRVRAHLESCATCRALLEDLQSIRGTLDPLRTAGVPARRPLWRRQVRMPLPAAAVLALLVLVAPFIAFRRGESAAPAQHPNLSRAPEVFARYDGGGRAVIYVRPREGKR